MYVGMARVGVYIPGARTLKDRRQAVRSLRDRLRARFDVTCHEVDPSDRPTRQVLLLTAGANDGALVRATLDKCVADARQRPDLLVEGVDVEVFQWHPEAALGPGLVGAEGETDG